MQVKESKMKKLLILAIAACFCPSLPAQVASHAPAVSMAKVPPGRGELDRPVASVNGAVLTQRDLVRQMENIFPYARQHGGRFPKDSEAAIRQQAMQQMVFEELVYQEARRRKMTVAPARLNAALADFRKQFDSPPDFQDYLRNEQGGSMDRLRQKVSRAILIEDLLKLEVNGKAKITDPELRKFYSDNKERFQKPESVSIQTISIVNPETFTAKQKADARQRAEDALRQAKTTKSYDEFGRLAEKVSEDDWRVMMGDHKSIHRGRMPAAVEKAVFAMKPGEVSGLIDTGDSFCIARVNAREESKLVPFAEVRASLKKDLEAQKAVERQKGFEARLKKNAQVEQM